MASGKPPVSSSRYVTLTGKMTGIGTAGSFFTASPVSGKIVRIDLACEAVVDANNAFSSKIAGTAITGGAATLTTTNFGTVGQVVSILPTGANDIKAGQAVEMITDGGGTVGQVTVTMLIDQI